MTSVSSDSQVALAWLPAQGYVAVPIPGIWLSCMFFINWHLWRVSEELDLIRDYIESQMQPKKIGTLPGA